MTLHTGTSGSALTAPHPRIHAIIRWLCMPLKDKANPTTTNRLTCNSPTFAKDEGSSDSPTKNSIAFLISTISIHPTISPPSYSMNTVLRYLGRSSCLRRRGSESTTHQTPVPYFPPQLTH